MTRKTDQPSIDPSAADLRIDYALMAAALSAAIFALVYLILT